jgi:hypothetical protein
MCKIYHFLTSNIKLIIMLIIKIDFKHKIASPKAFETTFEN